MQRVFTITCTPKGGHPEDRLWKGNYLLQQNRYEHDVPSCQKSGFVIKQFSCKRIFRPHVSSIIMKQTIVFQRQTFWAAFNELFLQCFLIKLLVFLYIYIRTTPQRGFHAESIHFTECSHGFLSAASAKISSNGLLLQSMRRQPSS